MIDSVKKEEEEEEEPVKTSKRRGKSGGKGKIEGKKKEEDGELQTKSVGMDVYVVIKVVCACYYITALLI